MINLKWIVNNREEFAEKTLARGISITFINEIVEKCDLYLQDLQYIEKLNANQNILINQITKLKLKNEDASKLISELNQVKEQIKNINDNKLDLSFLDYVPNIISANTPIGKDENDNKVIEEFSNLGRGLVNNVLPHYEIGQKLNLIDFHQSTTLSGSRFWSYINNGAKLLRALISFLLDLHIKNGYIEINPPLIVKPEVLYGVGQLPKFKDDVFELTNSKFLIPTAEAPLTTFYQNHIFPNLDKPLCLTAYTPCFRSEAGSGGKDVRGIIRGHQFHKVELVKVVSKENSQIEYKKMIDDASNILKILEIPFRKLQLCSGDLGFSASETIDLEVWLPSEQKYREISSISNCLDFQSRRAMIRYKKENKIHYAHTMNGSGLAIDRLIAAILENYQNIDGTISIPKVLIPYYGSDIIK
ncbi:MAG: serine--tRNA ligase [Mycoplasma sp.]|nr:serine--tRNA ligase [Mycoplasma sp.]